MCGNKFVFDTTYFDYGSCVRQCSLCMHPVRSRCCNYWAPSGSPIAPRFKLRAALTREWLAQAESSTTSGRTKALSIHHNDFLGVHLVVGSHAFNGPSRPRKGIDDHDDSGSRFPPKWRCAPRASWSRLRLSLHRTKVHAGKFGQNPWPHCAGLLARTRLTAMAWVG